GRNLFDHAHPGRAYFYVAEDHFTLGVREGRWKYIFDLREGVDELYDLVLDPNEQHNVAKIEVERELGANADGDRRRLARGRSGRRAGRHPRAVRGGGRAATRGSHYSLAA